ncbi:TPA: hypothetical protein ACSP84_002023 [Aeromonas veronii]
MKNNRKAVICCSLIALTLTGCSPPSSRFAECMSTYHDSNACISLEQANQARWQALIDSGKQLSATGAEMERQQQQVLQNTRPRQTICRQSPFNNTINCTTY